MQGSRTRYRRRLGVAALIALTLSSPAYAHGGGLIILEIARVLLEGMAHSVPPPAAVIAPAAMPVAAGPIVPLVIPDPEAKVGIDPTERLKDQELGYTSPGPAPTFRVRNFTRSFYTMVGGSAKNADGLVQQDGIADPAVTVSEDLAAAVSRHYGSHDVGMIQPPAASTTAAPAAPLGSGYMFQVSTTQWELKSVSSNPIHVLYGVSHYGIYYDAKFQLTDRRDGSLLAAGDCDVGPGATDPAPTYDETLANGGQRLNAMMQVAAHECALQLEEEYLGIHLSRDSKLKIGAQ